MLFAHGPIGSLLSFISIPWQKHRKIYSAKVQNQLLLIGFIGGVFPDIDLFYYYLYNASETHRGFITHLPVFYLVIFLAVALIFWITRKFRALIASFVFLLAVLSHLIVDMVLSQIRFFYPFYSGFLGITDLGNVFINDNLLFLNYLLEGIFSFFFFYVLISRFVKLKKNNFILKGILITVFALGVGMITYTNAHIYHGNTIEMWGDHDRDGIVNYEDRDLDGDNVLNIDDLDNDNDNIGNVEQLMQNIDDLLPVWYDPTDGGFINIPLRLGFITTNYLPSRLFRTIGLDLVSEMKADFAQNPQDYFSAPEDAKFDQHPENIQAWLKHQNKLEEGQALARGRNQIGDILFFQSGHMAIVSGFSQDGSSLVLDVHKNRPIMIKTFAELLAREGSLV